MLPKPPLPSGTIGDWCRWLLRRRRLVRVTGRSMLPTLQPGDLLFMDPKVYSTNLPQLDEIVVAWHPQQPGIKIIKRVGLIEADGTYLLLSDNPREGTDSLAFGTLPLSAILGKVDAYAIKSRPKAEQ